MSNNSKTNRSRVSATSAPFAKRFASFGLVPCTSLLSPLDVPIPYASVAATSPTNGSVPCAGSLAKDLLGAGPIREVVNEALTTFLNYYLSRSMSQVLRARHLRSLAPQEAMCYYDAEVKFWEGFEAAIKWLLPKIKTSKWSQASDDLSQTE